MIIDDVLLEVFDSYVISVYVTKKMNREVARAGARVEIVDAGEVSFFNHYVASSCDSLYTLDV
jgi:hypothetical protein